MVVLREGMCPGLDEDLVRSLRAADIKTGQYMAFEVTLIAGLRGQQGQ